MSEDEFDLGEYLSVALTQAGWYLSWRNALDDALKLAYYTGRRQRVGRSFLGVWRVEDARKRPRRSGAAEVVPFTRRGL